MPKQPPTSLLLVCIECGAPHPVQFLEVKPSVYSADRSPLRLTIDDLARQLGTDDWILSIVTPPGEGTVTLAPVCDTCAPKVHRQELLDAARKNTK